jgi:hypothetical protein
MNAITKQFVEELENLPEVMQVEVLDFVQFLKAKMDKQDTTEYLLSNPTNKQRLLDSITDLQAGNSIQQKLIEV